MTEDKSKKILECYPELAGVISTTIGALWDASEGDWDEASFTVVHRLKHAIEKLETCTGVKFPYVEQIYREHVVAKMPKENLSDLMSGAKLFAPTVIANVIRVLYGVEQP